MNESFAILNGEWFWHHPHRPDPSKSPLEPLGLIIDIELCRWKCRSRTFITRRPHKLNPGRRKTHPARYRRQRLLHNKKSTSEEISPRLPTPVIPEGTVINRCPNPSQFRFSGETPESHGTADVMIPTICWTVRVQHLHPNVQTVLFTIILSTKSAQIVEDTGSYPNYKPSNSRILETIWKNGMICGENNPYYAAEWLIHGYTLQCVQSPNAINKLCIKKEIKMGRLQFQPYG